MKWRPDMSRPVRTNDPRLDDPRYRMCGRKTGYGTRKQALGAIAYLRGVARQDGASPPVLYVYRCPFCRAWHLTHRAPVDQKVAA